MASQVTAKSSSIRKALPMIAVVIILLLGVVAGVFLVGQQQIFKSKAGEAVDIGSVNNLSNCSSIDIHPDAKPACSSICNNSGCTLPSAPQGVCEIRRFHTNDKDDPVVNDDQTGFVNNGGGNLGFIKSCGAEQIDVGCYTDELNHDGVYNDGFKTVAYAWRRYDQSCAGEVGQGSGSPPSDAPSGGNQGGVSDQCSDWCTSAQECANAGGTVVSSACSFDSCSATLVPCLTGSTSGSGGSTPSTPAPTPTPEPKLVCGEGCTTDAQCADATTGVATACRKGQCVNLGCYDSGGKTIYGSRCDCVKENECGAPCGGAIGLCKPGFACTYRGRSQCSSRNLGVCVPRGSNSANRGAMQGVPEYDGSTFNRAQCGSGTADPNNSYIQHTSFPNKVFNTQQVMKYICNPQPDIVVTPSPSPQTSIAARCLDVKVFDTNGDRLSNADLRSLKAGDRIQIAVSGTTTLGNIDKARFKINSGVIQETTTKRSGTNDYVIQYTIPQGATGLKIEAEVHHDSIGWL